MDADGGPPVILRKHEDRRVRAGHPWIFSNEIASPLGEHRPGDVVDVQDASGRPVGRGTINPHALIAVRLFSIAPAEPAGPERPTLKARIISAQELRRRVLKPLPAAFRLVFSESDFLPGLIVDRYADVLVVQALTAGIDRRLETVADVLEELFSPRAILLRNDSPLRVLEGLSREVRVLRGQFDGPLELEETPAPGLRPLRLTIDPLTGQKTGAFLDQRANRAAVLSLLEGGAVLDVFCHDGAWSLAAARAGAVSVLGIDSSATAIERARQAARVNGLEPICTFECRDAFEALRDLKAQGPRFDAVLLDPPAFIKSRARLAEGLKGYRTINQRALALVRPGGWLVSSSCSYHLDRETFRSVLTTAAQRSGRTLRLLEFRGQGRDHPCLLAAPETEYLKCAVCQVV